MVMNATLPVNSSRQLFLSAVSSEFRRCREMLRTDLTGPDMPWKVAEQADFAVGGSTLLEKLDRYIGDSSAVIHLIGEAAGECATPLEVDAFLAARPSFLARYPAIRKELGKCHALSYTQWEAYMALDHDVPVYVYSPDEDFRERQPGFTASDADRLSQTAHYDRFKLQGVDRSSFATADRLSSMVLRSLSGLVSRSGSVADKEFAQSLQGVAKVREASDEAGGEAGGKESILPFHLELLLPAYLIVGNSSRVEFRIREPGRTPLEDVEVELEIGSARVAARHDLLMRNEDVCLAVQIIPREAGSPQIRLAVTCTRLSSLSERFEWSSYTYVHPAERAAEISGSARPQFLTQPIDLTLQKEELRPRKGACGLELRPVAATGRRFEMGSGKGERGRQEDEDVHPVRFSRSWWMARHPVSQAQYGTVMGGNPSKFSAQSLDLPVENVTWHEAAEFCERLTQMERAEENLPLGFLYRLPTEAEWEFCCQNMDVPGSGGTESGLAANIISTFPLDGNRGANHFGLCDMTGNVFHWCLDGYGPYPQGIEVDPCLAGDGINRVIRGGSWHDPLSFRRPAARAKCGPETRSSRIGFRVVLARV
ncbi:MAG: Formylglycine-rating enzyme required for sulfatase, contains domain [Verrucomicrobiaceae bacterium]|nr:Formylglycine-rating enzyme required for sulfatase, contains domain [Verrucomicrobiaceae bacterium]